MGQAATRPEWGHAGSGRHRETDTRNPEKHSKTKENETEKSHRSRADTTKDDAVGVGTTRLIFTSRRGTGERSSPSRVAEDGNRSLYFDTGEGVRRVELRDAATTAMGRLVSPIPRIDEPNFETQTSPSDMEKSPTGSAMATPIDRARVPNRRNGLPGSNETPAAPHEGPRKRRNLGRITEE